VLKDLVSKLLISIQASENTLHIKQVANAQQMHNKATFHAQLHTRQMHNKAKIL
jgi:hypothetical protein